MARSVWILVLIAVLLSAVGVVSIANASSTPFMFSKASHAAKQAAFALVGFCALVLVARVSYLRVREYSYVVYGLLLLALALLLVCGRVVHGARRWFTLGPFSLQPSEWMKIGLVLALAKYMMYRKNLSRLTGLMAPFVMTLVPMALVVIQPDLGSALVFIPVLLVMLFVGGARVKHLATAVVAGVASIPLAYHFLLHGYQKRRLEAFLDPSKYELMEGYQLFHSKIAIGAGGWFGSSWQVAGGQYHEFVPKRHNDFIFSVVGGEWGFVGSFLVLALFLVFFIIALRVAYRTREPFARLVVTGLLTIFLVQVFINVGMAVGIAPVTGITLPFLSYGGSSLLTCYLCVGLILAVARKPVPTYSERDFEYRSNQIPELGVKKWLG